MMENEKRPHELGIDKTLPRGVTFADWLVRMSTLMSALYGRDRADSREQMAEMFALYNMAFNPSQHNQACSSCVRKVYHRMSHYYKKYVLEAEKETEKETEPAEPPAPAKKKSGRSR